MTQTVVLSGMFGEGPNWKPAFFFLEALTTILNLKVLRVYKTKKTPHQEPAGLKLQQQHR